MSDSRHCPECESNIGIWAVFKATLPNRIFCPKCGQRLQHTPITGLVTAAVVFTILLCVGVSCVIMQLWDKGMIFAVMVGAGVLIAGGALIETAFVTILWYGDYELKSVGKRRAVEDVDHDGW
jgi:hypothetical protein